MAMQQLFHLVSSDQSRDFMIRLSYVEIYNEIINDLLDPARENLRVVDDALRGQVSPLAEGSPCAMGIAPMAGIFSPGTIPAENREWTAEGLTGGSV